MEDALRDVVRLRRRGGYPVLILVLMEDALRVVLGASELYRETGS